MSVRPSLCIVPSRSRRGSARFIQAIAHATRHGFRGCTVEGIAHLEGVMAKRARRLSDLPHMLQCQRALPVADAPLEAVMAQVKPNVLVDARMRKRDQPEVQRGLAFLTIGLGPNFEAGGNVDVAVETVWGKELGAVIRIGRTKEFEGEPMPIGGHARDRYVYAPVAGLFMTRFNIGDPVVLDEELARIGDTVVHPPLSGCLRGITHNGAPVNLGTKIVEVDPRADARAVRGLGERPRRIAEGVLAAIGESHITRAR